VDAQLPTGYENYPRPEETERDAIASGWQNPPAPATMAHRYQGREPYPPIPPQGSRRSLLLGVVGVGVVAVIGLGAMPHTPDPTEAQPGDPLDTVDPFDPSADEEVDTTVLSFGGLDLDVPSGWTVMADGDARALLTRGHNQILMVRYEGTSPDPAKELDLAIAQSGTAFHGSLSKAKRTTEVDYLRAVKTGTGTFEGRPARQSAEVLVSNEDLSTLFIQQVLSASEKSDIAADAARLAADLRDSWPW
jgi:hypothetical protein